jgi:hypothetical protein
MVPDTFSSPPSRASEESHKWFLTPFLPHWIRTSTSSARCSPISPCRCTGSPRTPKAQAAGTARVTRPFPGKPYSCPTLTPLHLLLFQRANGRLSGQGPNTYRADMPCRIRRASQNGGWQQCDTRSTPEVHRRSRATSGRTRAPLMFETRTGKGRRESWGPASRPTPSGDQASRFVFTADERRPAMAALERFLGRRRSIRGRCRPACGTAARHGHARFRSWPPSAADPPSQPGCQQIFFR